MTLQTQNQQSSLILLIILSALMAFTSLSTDIYLPAMPVMQQTLGGNAELTITGFLIGFAIAQLIWGPISDRVGRKLPLLIGMVLFVIGSVGCAMSQTMNGVIFWRVFQALGACVGPMLSRAMIRDLYDSTQAAKMLSTLVMMMAIAPIAGPLLGGVLLKVSSWHAIFWLLVVIGIAMFMAVMRLPESLPANKRSQQSLLQAFGNYRTLLSNKLYMRYTLCVTFFYTAIYAFITGSPFVYIDYFGIPAQYYGWLFGVNILGVVMLSALNRYLVVHVALDKLLKISAFIAVFGAVMLLGLSLAGIGGIWGIALPMWLIFSMNGVVASCTNAAGLACVADNMTGSAAALMGSLQYGSGIISSVLLVMFSDTTPQTMVWIIVIFIGLAASMAWQKDSKSAQGLAQVG